MGFIHKTNQKLKKAFNEMYENYLKDKNLNMRLNAYKISIKRILEAERARS